MGFMQCGRSEVRFPLCEFVRAKVESDPTFSWRYFLANIIFH